MKTFAQYWEALERKKGKPIEGEIRMSADQFKAVQRQAYDIGRKHEKTKREDFKTFVDTLCGNLPGR